MSYHFPCFPKSSNSVDSGVASGNSDSQSEEDSISINSVKYMTYGQIAIATKNFNGRNYLSRGGFGVVFRGQLGEREVVVKCLDQTGQQGNEEFEVELKMLKRLSHPNIVTLTGYCREDRKGNPPDRILVYEYVSLGSLDHLIHDHGKTPLNWNARMKIASGAAAALQYLHERNCPVIFRDFKPSNILVGEDYVPKLSDFGVAIYGDQADPSIKGTLGYVDPEYVATGHLTPKVDVYSFGVVLLELITSHKAIDRNRVPNEQKLVDWIRPFLTDIDIIQTLVDQRLRGNFPMEELNETMAIAARCVNENYVVRPAMRDVVNDMKDLGTQ